VEETTHRLTRREFLAGAAAGAATLAAGGLATRAEAATVPLSAPTEGPWVEAGIPELQAMMASGQLTSRDLTSSYLARIAQIDPILHSVIETNPDALDIAGQLDRERRAGQVRGPLHGIPILLKDNIATDDRMETTAGSLALVGSQVPADSPLVAKLRASGAVILGKANLSEWANFRGGRPDGIFINGWSARGGFTRNPYVLDFDPCGSSSGSAVAPAANLCAAAVGTETDGSIVCPAGNNLVVGLKPTLGLISQQGIIPIAHSQDTAGPMARTVTDAAILLNSMVTPFGRVAESRLPSDYTAFLKRGALNGARIGVDRRMFLPEYFALPELNAVVEVAIGVMASLGAVIVDPVDTGDPFAYFDAEFTVLLYEFKGDIANYLSTLRGTRMRTLADLIAFNLAHCEEEMTYLDQFIFELAEATSGDLTDPEYLSARALCLQLARDQGIRRVMRDHNLDAVVSPSYAFGSSAPAVAGFPSISVPVGTATTGWPAGIWMYAGFLEEHKLLAYSYDLEQEMQPRIQPTFLNEVPAPPPPLGLCDGTQGTSLTRVDRAVHPGTGRLIPSRG
jgi:amidase